jgi:hypothetical protein
MENPTSKLKRPATAGLATVVEVICVTVFGSIATQLPVIEALLPSCSESDAAHRYVLPLSYCMVSIAITAETPDKVGTHL